MNFQGIQSWDFHRSQSRPVPKSLPLPVPFSSCSQIPAFQLDPLEVRRIYAGFPMNVLRIRRIVLNVLQVSARYSAICAPGVRRMFSGLSAGCPPVFLPDVRRFFRQMSGERRISVPKYGTMCILDMLFLNPGFRIVMKAI